MDRSCTCIVNDMIPLVRRLPAGTCILQCSGSTIMNNPRILKPSHFRSIQKRSPLKRRKERWNGEDDVLDRFSGSFFGYHFDISDLERNELLYRPGWIIASAMDAYCSSGSFKEPGLSDLVVVSSAVI